jgi:hypothetical protein
MKSKILSCTLLALSIAFMSCKKEEEAEAETSTTAQQPIMIPPVEHSIRTENYVQPNQQVTMPAQNVPQAVTQAPVVTKAGMNPPHGQPGHRCDIAVGAPLNSPPGKPAKPAAVPGQAAFTQATIPTPAATSQPSGTPALLRTDTPAATAPGMNPPHGQPGHQCGVPVGSPLPKTPDSK